MRIDINGTIRDMTPEEIAAMQTKQPTAEEQISAIKEQLTATDYMAIKFAEGWLSEADYAPIKAQRQAWRETIGELGG